MFKKPSSGKKTNLSQFGLLDVDIDDDGDEPMDLSDDDVDLEAELAAISGGGPKRHRPRKPAPVASANLDAMIAASLKDIPSDEEDTGKMILDNAKRMICHQLMLESKYKCLEIANNVSSNS
ncbi:coiled-coil and C2 domain-containing protein 1-like [Ostrinia furnacalis]|uniref:coiled-coil and C2 domain-containing protein 1-like n=1 Tax=Ostrinia furnacalis TaxID=93504 RepID=UPI001040A045|nr:coiled-coil and C2 domain-containing protein 1-like [Ostrinia furnacalis]